MSLFPAYSESNAAQQPTVIAASSADKTDPAKDWTNNQSYDLPTAVIPTVDSELSTDTESNSDTNDELDSDRPDLHGSTSKRILEFDSTDEFYVDKKSNKIYNEWSRLPRLSRPQYTIRLTRLEDTRYPYRSKKKEKRSSRSRRFPAASVEPKLTDDQIADITVRIGKLKTQLANRPQQLDKWLELHRLLGQNVSKSNRLAVAEQQLHTLETALQHHAGNEKLLELYVATASATYPDSQVATKIEQLLEREPFDYTLWTALIMSTQGTMARCNVPDVLHIYEQSMRRMHLGHKEQLVHTDELMLRLFHNCVLFLRQSANSGHMFALLKLALELNAPHLSFDCFVASAETERPLIDYEELVLHSGMPMPEIWTRIERLRQAYNFLPYPEARGGQDTADTGLDAQRCIYTSDVCHYIYPLKNKDNTLQLLLLVVQLTKLPFVRTHCLAERLSARLEQIGDSEAIEMLLASLGERSSYALPLQADADYQLTLQQLAKELYVSPTFLPHAIGHELYEQCISSLLLKCSEVFASSTYELVTVQESQRQVFLLLWFRFERVRLLLLQLSGKLDAQYVQAARLRHRELLRQDVNRNVTRFYTELAMFEFEAAPKEPRAFRVLDNIINAQSPDVANVELLHALVVYAEMLIGSQQPERALHMLSCLALQQSPQSSATDISNQLQLALKLSRQQLDAAFAMAAETIGQLMLLEEYFMPNRLLLLVRAHCLMLCLLDQTQAAVEVLQQLLDTKTFGLELTRSRFLREQLRELQLLVYQLPLQLSHRYATSLTGKQLVDLLEQSMLEFPRNLALLQRWTTLSTLPWYKLRRRLVHTKSGILALLHLVIAARCRFNQQSVWLQQHQPLEEYKGPHDMEHLQHLVRNRVLSMFETFLPNNPHRSQEEIAQYDVLRRNSLYWRCYLRCLSDVQTSFERSKSCLLMALDECPWDKALYMDGATYVPQEIGNLQDVMTEKQVRIYALPEELMVLRED